MAVSPNLHDFDFIRFDTTYAFSVKNVPGEYIGAQINRGIIIKIGPQDYEFFVHPPKDSIEINIYAQVEGVRKDIYIVRKKMKEQQPLTTVADSHLFIPSKSDNK